VEDIMEPSVASAPAATLGSAMRDGSVRIRLNEAADNVEIEFIDENKSSNN
jgi:hypothetical protein